ncbi:MAG: beta-galactosidase [Kiritimatiellae bacterium]|nr:beta-galactosidase [Kiritimatiellia bacterium]
MKATQSILQFHGLGAAFYPEHHPREQWADYVSLLSKSGLGFVRVAEFAWDKLEPCEGQFDFAWLDEALRLLKRRGVRAIMCTPTAAPPLWACERYPEILPVLEDGSTYGFGQRRYACPTSPAYLRLSSGVAAAMARHYGRSPQILAWQIDNEFGHPFCFCARCQGLFQEWCRKRFGTIRRFNDALCTHFWGQTLADFSQVAFPVKNGHPGYWQLYHRFHSEAIIACYRRQADALRANGAVAPVTTNMMPTWYGYDHEEMASHLDVIAGDHYGLHSQRLFGDYFANEVFVHEYLRGLKHGQPVWFLEFQCDRNQPPLPGMTRWEALTQVGLGANLIDYFRFDTCPSGNERGGGMVGVDRKTGRVYREIRGVASDLRKLRSHLDGTTAPPAKVAFLFTFANHCEFTRNVHHREFEGPFGNGYAMHVARHMQAITRLNIRTTIAHPDDDFAKYEIVIAPALYLCPRTLAARLERFVAQGGTLLLTSYSGYANEYGTLWETPIPAPMSAMFGLEVHDYGGNFANAGAIAIRPESDQLQFKPIDDIRHIDEIRTHDRRVEVLATYDNAFFRNLPAITRRQHGRGWAYYLGALLGQSGYESVYQGLVRHWKLAPLLELPAGIYATARVKGRRRIVFINNPNGHPQKLDLKRAYVDLIGTRRIAGRITLKPFEVLVLSGSIVDGPTEA